MKTSKNRDANFFRYAISLVSSTISSPAAAVTPWRESGVFPGANVRVVYYASRGLGISIEPKSDVSAPWKRRQVTNLRQLISVFDDDVLV